MKEQSLNDVIENIARTPVDVAKAVEADQLQQPEVRVSPGGIKYIERQQGGYSYFLWV